MKEKKPQFPTDKTEGLQPAVGCVIVVVLAMICIGVGILLGKYC